ncbi:uncharacterized protein LOC144436815 [Glandiceps talaboti]
MIEPPDGGYGWFITAGSFLLFFIVGGAFYSFGVLYVAFLEAFGASKASTAWIGSLFAAAGIVGNPISLALCSRYGHRKVVMTAGLISAIGLILSSFTTSLGQIYITYGVITSVAYWVIPLPSLVMIGKYFKNRLAIAMGIALAGTGAGQFIQSLVTQILLDNYGWRGTLLILAGLSLNICVGGALLRPLEQNPISENDKSEKEKAGCKHSDSMQKVVTHSASILGIIAIESLSNSDDLQVRIQSSSLLGSHDDCHNTKDHDCPLSEVHNNCCDSQQVIVQSSSLSRSQIDCSEVITFSASSSSSSSSSGSLNSYDDMQHLDRDQDSSKSESESDNSDTHQVKVQSSSSIPNVLFHVKYSGNLSKVKEDQIIMVRKKNISEKKTDEKKHASPRCSQCLSSGIRKLEKLFKAMYDLSLFRIAVFVLMLCTAFGHSAAQYAVLSHVVKRGQDFGISTFQSSSLPAVTGLTQCIGRLFWGILGVAFKRLTPQFLYAASMGTCGLMTIVSMYTVSYAGQLAYMIVFGICMACYIPMFPVVLRNYLGAEKLDHALSMFLQAQGIGAMISAPFIGWMRDVQGHYNGGFYVIAVLFILSSTLAFLVPVADKRIDQRRAANGNKTYTVHVV